MLRTNVSEIFSVSIIRVYVRSNIMMETGGDL
jgi:hypothetical protein